MSVIASKGANEGLLSNLHIKRAAMYGMLLVVAGFAVEAWFPGIVDFINSFRVGYVKPGENHGGGHSLTLLNLAVLLLKELGVAFLVASIIGWAIEKQAKERDNQRAMQLREDVANDAVFALYGLRHRRDFIKAVVETNLEAKIVREDMKVAYSLRTLSREEADVVSPKKPADALERFVVLEMTSTYTFRNVAASGELAIIRYAIALRQGAGARQLTKAHYVCIDDKQLNDKEIEAGISAPENSDDLTYQWQRPLDPNGTVRVIISARCVKERSDNEVWGSFFPTMGNMDLSLTVLPGMRFGVRELSSASLSSKLSVPSDVSRSWTLTGPLLRHNSIVFWWRTPEDDAEEDEISAPVEFSTPDPAAELPSVPASERRGWFRSLLDLKFSQG